MSDEDWAAIAPHLPKNQPGARRVDDRRVINGILWRFRTGTAWADIPERYGPSKTCYNRFVRWQKAGHWSAILDAVTKAYDELVMIDSTMMRVHQHGATASKKGAQIMAWDVPGAA